RLTGKFRSAFPDGRPQPPVPPAKKDAKKDEEKKAAAEPHLKSTSAENSIVLVADADMLADGAAVEVQDIFGQRVVVPRNGNLAFAQGLVEQFSGDSALITLRSRASFSRPLTVVREMEERAQQSYLGKIKELEDTLNKTQENLQALQKGKGGAQSTILTGDQQAELENFR